ncbi:MAG TPA: hypothetical protein VGE38_07205 [Nocardioides sp.]|uniref:hypothetical protein n=1 Tax=Nocardioides sp. TaxID=35761 RepID=UPI002ED78A41
MPTITTVDATWDTGVTMDAAELRRADTAMFLGDGAANGVRGGIVRHGDTSLAVSVNGSDQVTVQPGAFAIPAATGLGVYRGALSAATSAVALTARNGTNPRIDLVVIQVTGTNATVKTIDGTPGSSPSAPALPAQHIELARVTVPQVGGGAVTVDSSWRAYATGLGGTLLVETSARLPGSGNQKGQRAVALDTARGHTWNGTTWVADGQWGAYTPAWTSTGTAPSLGNGTLTGRYIDDNKKITAYVDFRGGSTSTFGTGSYRWSLPVPAAASYTAPAALGGWFYVEDVGGIGYMAFPRLVTSTTFELVFHSVTTVGALSTIVGATAPFTFAVNDFTRGHVEYEAA